jgi:hypothetical protein
MVVYRVGDYPHLYVEIDKSEECGRGFVDFYKIVEETFTGCLKEVVIMREGYTLLSLEYRPLSKSGRLCIEIQPYGEAEYAYIACLGEKKPQYIEDRSLFIITESYDEGLISRIGNFLYSVYSFGTLEGRVVKRNALDLFLYEEKNLPNMWEDGYIRYEEMGKKSVRLYRRKRKGSIPVKYAVFLSYVVFRVFDGLCIGNLPFNYVVNPGEPQHLSELDRIVVKNIISFNDRI